MKILEDNTGENLDALEYDDVFLDTTPKMRSMKEIIDELDFIKTESFCSVKDNIKRTRRQATDWGKIFVKDTSDKGMLYKLCKELIKTQ